MSERKTNVERIKNAYKAYILSIGTEYQYDAFRAYTEVIKGFCGEIVNEARTEARKELKNDREGK